MQNLLSGLISIGSYKSIPRPMYEGEFTDRFVAASKDAFVVDCGARMGYYTYIAEWASARRIVAFEPDARFYPSLERWASDKPSVEISRNAVCNHVGAVGLFKSGPKSLAATSAISSHSVEIRWPQEVIEVPCTTLDEYACDGADVLKMDIEGSELEALRGAEKTLDVYAPMLFLEVHSLGPDKLDELAEFLRRARYSVVWRSHKGERLKGHVILEKTVSV